MKIRNGFVSNSSSSSFICEICNATVTAMDGSLEDAEMVSCVYHEHTFCESHVLNVPGFEEYGRYELPTELCPICNFVEASYPDLAKYLEVTTKITRDEIFAEIKKINKRRRKLYENEYVEAACKRTNQTVEGILVNLKEKYKTYTAFKEFCRLPPVPVE